MNRNVLFIVENAEVPRDMRVWNEALAVKEFGYEVSIICPKKNRKSLKYENINDIEIYRHPMITEGNNHVSLIIEYLNALFWQLLYSIKIFIKKPIHIIHAANPPDNIFLIAILFKIVGIKFIFDHHDISPEVYIAKFKRKDIFYRILLMLEKMSFKLSDIVISTNESYKKIAITRGHKRVDEVFVVRNAPDLSVLESIKTNLSIKKDFEYLVGYIGVIGEQEQLEVLLKAVYHIVNRKKIRNIKFVIIGGGSHKQAMVELSKKLKLEKYVEFTGYIPHPEFYDILMVTDLCVNPEYKSIYTDKSTMIKIMEYMASGKPVVQFETTEGKKTAGDAAIYVKNNDYVEFAKAIIGLLNDPEKRKRMGEIGRKRIKEKLNWDLQKTNLKRAYYYLEGKSIR